MNPAPLDGNATAGDLSDMFTFDVTTAVTTCASCRDTHPMATLHAYLQAPGIVLRCCSCDAVQVRVVHSPARAWLDLRGTELLEIPLASDRHHRRLAGADGVGEKGTALTVAEDAGDGVEL